MRNAVLAALGAALVVTSPALAQPRPSEPSRPPEPRQVDRPRDAASDPVRRLEEELHATRSRLAILEAELRRAKDAQRRPEGPRPGDDRGRPDRPVGPMGPPDFPRGGRGPEGYRLPSPPISNTAGVEQRLERIEKVLGEIRDVLRQQAIRP